MVGKRKSYKLDLGGVVLGKEKDGNKERHRNQERKRGLSCISAAEMADKLDKDQAGLATIRSWWLSKKGPMEDGDKITSVTAILGKVEQAFGNQSQGCIRLEPRWYTKVRKSRGLKREPRHDRVRI